MSSFKKLLATADLPGLSLSSVPPGYVYDPARHERPEPAAAPVPVVDQLTELRTRIARVTEIPNLTTAEYRTLFTELAEEVNAHGYSRNVTSRVVRDRCAARGAAVGRNAVNFVLTGLTYAGHSPRSGDTAAVLAAAYADNVLALCQNARMELSDHETALIREWLLPTTAR
jgi:hypothetical protein